MNDHDPTPYEMLDNESQRIVMRGVTGIFALVIGGLLSFLGLIFYMANGNNLNWTLFHIWFGGTSATVAIGISFINKRLERFMLRQQDAIDNGENLSDTQ